MVKHDVNHNQYMNLFSEAKNFCLNEVNIKSRISINTLANFSNRNSMIFAQFNRYFPTISTTINKNMDNQDLTSKIRTRTKRDQDEENGVGMSMMNIRKFFDPTIYQMLLNPQEHNLRNEKLVIVFWDIAGFATLCNTLNKHPFIIVDLLRNFFSDVERVIRKYNGIIDKFIGDGIMAFFGYNQVNEYQMTSDAINTALELRERFKITIKHLI
jgi:hypothetical protein